MDRDDIIKMAREAGFNPVSYMGANLESFERFAALVAAAEREKVAAWMIARGYATGHGDSVEDLLQELDWQIREQERQVVLAAIDELRGAERSRNNMFSEGYDYALGHIKEVVEGVSNDQRT